ncbi:SAG family member [Eimeria praecox]|uniref:SAG family member n=1 Tax=Eimeria praecox TaxID=51316 RepID=U6G0T8_9EIME|nr:SAG family member [Eimeria praecox]
MAALSVVANEAQKETAQGNTASPVNCLSAFNEARVRAQLDPFTTENVDAQKLPIEDQEYVNAVCKALEKDGVAKNSFVSHKNEGTYSFAEQTGETADCSAAISHWAKALEYFDEIPPVYISDHAGSYANVRNRSFVALFTPIEGAAIDCAYFICPTTSTTTTTPVPTTTKESPTTTITQHTTTQTTSVTQTPNQPTGTQKPPTQVSDPSKPNGDSPSTNSEESTPSNQETEHPKADEAEEGSKTDPKEGIVQRRLESVTPDIRALVCLASPRVLVPGRRPFS